MVFFYLHGWASSPYSNKAQFFKQCFAEHHLVLQVPDLNQGDFYHLTLTRQIQQVQALLPTQPVTVIGSSFGGLTALWLAEKRPQIQRLVLLAPALNFAIYSFNVLTEAQRQEWRDRGELKFFHYAAGQELPVSYNFIEDLQGYTDADVRRQLPTLILHGVHDEVIPITASREFAATRPWIQLLELDSDHSLASVQSQLWQEIQCFCELTR